MLKWRSLYLGLALLSIIPEAKAETVILPSNGTFEVIGPFATDPIFGPEPILISISLSVSGQIPNHTPGAQLVAAASASIDSANQTLNLYSCGSTNPGPCGGGFPPNNGFLTASSVEDVFTVASSGSGFGIDVNTPPYFISFGPVTAILTADIPTGFSIATAVPEPSTWAMLLIGFVAIGFASGRRSVILRG